MRLEDRFFIGETGTRRSGHFPNVSIDSFNIRELLKRLDKKEIKINLSRSEKMIDYDKSSNPNPVFIPFLLPIAPILYKILGYKLVVDKLIICIDDFHKAISENPGAIGSSVYIEDGVNVKVSFEGEYEDGAILKRVKEVIKNYYRDRIYSSPIGLPTLKDLKRKNKK
jgi:hypothetical protein